MHFLFNIFLRVRAIYAQPFVLKLTYANSENLTSTVFTQFTLEITISYCALGCVCCLQWQDRVPSRQLQVVRAEVVVDLQIV